MLQMQAPVSKAGCFGTSRPRVCVRSAVPARAPLTVANSYKTKENIDLSGVDKYKRHPTDVGSPEVQVARLSARITQLTSHLQQHRKDHAARRGLDFILNQRKSVLKYLHDNNRAAYDRVLADMGLRSVIVSDTRGASRNKDDKATVN